MNPKILVAGTALFLLGACQGGFPKSAETICEESGTARQSDAFQTCVAEQRRFAAERRRTAQQRFRRTHRGPRGR